VSPVCEYESSVNWTHPRRIILSSCREGVYDKLVEMDSDSLPASESDVLLLKFFRGKL
jgi:hypothetical protein